jgi:ABC-type uncharacterized transport system ATPase subunit
MSPKKRKAELLQIVEFHAEARRLAGSLSDTQRRVIEVGMRGAWNSNQPAGWPENNVEEFGKAKPE